MTNEKMDAADSVTLSKQQMNAIIGGDIVEVQLPDGTIIQVRT